MIERRNWKLGKLLRAQFSNALGSDTYHQQPLGDCFCICWGTRCLQLLLSSTIQLVAILEKLFSFNAWGNTG